MKKTAQSYPDGPQFGYDPASDYMGETAPDPRAPAWAPYAALGGAALLGYAGLRGMGRLFRGTPKALPHIDPRAAGELEMLGRVNPRIERMASDVVDRTAKTQRVATHEAGLRAEGLMPKVSAVIVGLGHIARGR